MGNSPPYVVQLGNLASINILEGQANGEHYEMRSVSFRADERIAEVSVKVFKGPDKKPNGKFLISITDSDKTNFATLPVRFWPYRFEMMVEREEGNHVKVNYAKTKVVHDKDYIIWLATLARVGITFPRLNLYERDATKNRKMTTASDGGITETALNPYRVVGRDRQKGLVVIEWKKKVWNQNPYEVVVSHYFASLQGNNTGFSVVARIRGEDGPDALKLEGPDFHPATALFEMFDKVLRSGSWTPNACPHCAACNTNAATKPSQVPMSPSNHSNNGESSKRNQQVFPPNESSQVTMSPSKNNNGESSKRNQQAFPTNQSQGQQLQPWFRSLLDN